MSAWEKMPTEGTRVVVTADYMAAVNHPNGEEWIGTTDAGVVTEVSEDFGRVYVRIDRSILGLEDSDNEVVVCVEDANDAGVSLARHFWSHFEQEVQS